MSDASLKQYVAVPMPDGDILEHVDSILGKQGESKAWGKAEHLCLLGNIFEEHASGVVEGNDTAKARKDFMATMVKHGIGGNDSQFRQFLQSEEGGRRLPESKGKRQADLLSKYD